MTMLAASLLFLPLTTTTTNNITLAQSDDGKGGLTTTQNSSGSFKTNDNTTTALAAENLTEYQSDADGFRMGIHDGWVIEDIDNTTPESQDKESRFGFAPLAEICLQEDALLTASGTYECPEEADPTLHIIRFPELSTRQVFQPAMQQNATVTLDDFVGSLANLIQNVTGFKDVRMHDSADQPMNVIDPQTNQTVATIPSKVLLYSYTVPNPFSGPSPFSGKMIELKEMELVGFLAAALNNDTDTAYLFAADLSPGARMVHPENPHMGEQMGTMMDSFLFLATSTTTNDAGAATG